MARFMSRFGHRSKSELAHSLHRRDIAEKNGKAASGHLVSLAATILGTVGAAAVAGYASQKWDLRPLGMSLDMTAGIVGLSVGLIGGKRAGIVGQVALVAGWGSACGWAYSLGRQRGGATPPPPGPI